MNRTQSSLRKKNMWRTGRIALLVVLLIIMAVVGFGCIHGLAPIGWSAGTVSDGTLFIGSREGRLVAINVADESESRRWSTQLKAVSQGGLFGCSPAMGGTGCGTGASGVAIYGTPVVSGDRVYMGGYNGKFYSYDVATLQVDDVFPPEGNLEPIVGGAVTSHGKIYFGNTDGNLYALNADSLLMEWVFPTGDKIWATPAVSDGTVYIGSFDKKLYAVNAADGSQKWARETEGAIVATPLVDNGIIYVGSFDKNLYALNAADGGIKWQFTAESWFWAEPVIYNGNLYAACLDGNVYVLQAATGKLVTQVELDSPVSSRPVIVDDDVIVASREGIVYTINTRSYGLNQLAAFEDEEINGPLTAYEGIIYIQGQELKLHRINALNGALLTTVSLKSQE